MKKMVLLACWMAFSPVGAKLVQRTVDYADGAVTLEGYLAYDDALRSPHPGVLVVHEWNGLGHYVEGRVDQLAALGYVAFAPDIYGKGVRPDSFEGCKAESTKYYQDRALLRRRVNLGLDQLRKVPGVDPKRIAAIGYCFGGAAVLELGRSGAEVAGIVTFHGGLDDPNPSDARNIKAKVLVCQGGADTFTLKSLPAFKKEMDDAKVDYRVITYKGAVHGFTNPDNKGKVPGLEYDAKADKASWKAMRMFFAKIFGP